MRLSSQGLPPVAHPSRGRPGRLRRRLRIALRHHDLHLGLCHQQLSLEFRELDGGVLQWGHANVFRSKFPDAGSLLLFPQGVSLALRFTQNKRVLSEESWNVMDVYIAHHESARAPGERLDRRI